MINQQHRANQPVNRIRRSALASGLVVGLSLLCVALAQAQAGTQQQGQEWNGTRASIIAGTGVAGALLGGPVGLVVGVAVGDWFGTSINKAGQLTGLSEQRNCAVAELAKAQEQRNYALAELAKAQEQLDWGRSHPRPVRGLHALELTIMFATAEDQVNSRALPQLDALAGLLKERPELTVQLSGYADPRGAEDYNQGLSERRAKSVEAYLISKGVSEQRIRSIGCGERMPKGERDLDAFAMERVVTITLQSGDVESLGVAFPVACCEVVQSVRRCP